MGRLVSVRLPSSGGKGERVGGDRVAVSRGGAGRAAIGGQLLYIGRGGAHKNGGRGGGVGWLTGGQNKRLRGGRIGVTRAGGLRGAIGGDIRGHWGLGKGLETSVTDVRLGGSIAGLLIAGLGGVSGGSGRGGLEASIGDLWRSGEVTGVLGPAVRQSSGCGARAVSGGHNWRGIGGGDNRGGGDTIGLQRLLIALGEALVIELILGHRVSQGHTIGLGWGGHRGSKGAADNWLVGSGLGGVHRSASVDKGCQRC